MSEEGEHLYLIVNVGISDLCDVDSMLNEWDAGAAVWAVLLDTQEVHAATITDHDNGEYEIQAGDLYEYLLYEDGEIVEHRYQRDGEETVVVANDALDEDDEEATG